MKSNIEVFNNYNIIETVIIVEKIYLHSKQCKNKKFIFKELLNLFASQNSLLLFIIVAHCPEM